MGVSSQGTYTYLNEEYLSILTTTEALMDAVVSSQVTATDLKG